MSKITDLLHAWFPKHKPLAPGVFTFHTSPDDPTQYRLHLRVDPDGEGVLIVNASSVLHLNQTGTEIAYSIMKGEKLEQIIDSLYHRFNASREIIAEDVRVFESKLHDLLMKTDQDPISDFGFEAHQKIEDISAPYRLDCCLTNRTNGENNPAESEHDMELDTSAWKTIIEKAFNAGIPHIVFTGGEPTLRDDLMELIHYAENLGLVTGLLGSGRQLAEETYLEKLIASGLDHLVYQFSPSDEVQMQALRKILPLDLYTCVAIKIENGIDYQPVINELIALGANAFAFKSGESVSTDYYLILTDLVQSRGVKLIPDIPLSLQDLEDLAHRKNSTARLSGEEFIQLRLTPDGEVFPAFNLKPDLGNLLKEDWKSIWERRFIG